MSYANSLGNGVMAKLMKDIRNLSRKPLEDIEIRLNDSLYSGSSDSLESIEATILGPKDTAYEGGEFVIRLIFGNDFPNAPPKGYFLTKIFHPNVAPNSGEICVNTLKRDWKPKYGIRHILIAIRSLLIVPNHDSALNQEAGKLLLHSYDDFVTRAKMHTQIHAIKKQNQNQNQDNDNTMSTMVVEDDSSDLDATTANENEEASTKGHSKTKSNDDDNNGNENSNNESELKEDFGNENDNSNVGINGENHGRKSNKPKSKDKQKKKSKKGKSKVRLTKSMMRL